MNKVMVKCSCGSDHLQDEEEVLADAQNKENEAPAESTAQVPEKREPKEKLPKRIYTDSEADRYEKHAFYRCLLFYKSFESTRVSCIFRSNDENR